MKRSIFFLLFAIVFFCTKAKVPSSLQVKQYTLKNGLTVWLNEDHNQPKIFGAIVVKAGAKDCPDTGIAHYFEHMMFKGTDKIGTTDYFAEKIWLDSIAKKYDELATKISPNERNNIQKEINTLSIKAGEYAIPNEFDRLLSRYGGTGINAGTSYDCTVYYNTFSPQYIAQWAEINSERLINPVFRLFQSELETVYEEKNMYSDFIGYQTIENLTKRYFEPHPYAYPILGNTDNLKSPRLTQMARFFKDYYVGSNMGLILSGDFDTQTVLPILEKTFSKIPSGTAPRSGTAPPPPFKGKEHFKIKLPIPIVKIMGLGFRGVPANHKDQIALNIAIGILNNSNGTGYLDQLSSGHKLLGAQAINESLNDAGILGILVMPKIIFQSYSSAEKLVWKQIERIKEGDFTDEMFRNLKLEQKRYYDTQMEDIDSRSSVMMELFSQGKTWDDYLNFVNRIDSLTKEDVIEAAKTYFNGNYLYVTKKTGNYPKDNISKPDFNPIVPKNSEAKSKYALQLEQMPVINHPPKYIDFDKDIHTTGLTEFVTLYTTENPVNDIFSLDISYRTGILDNSILTHLADYLLYLGTDSITYQDFRNRLQSLGSTLSFSSDDKSFIIHISGYDNHFDETLVLVGNFMKNAKADKKQLKQIRNNEQLEKHSFFKSGDMIANAILEKVMYGNSSRYLTKFSYPEVKKIKEDQLLKAFAHIQEIACDIHYCGKLSSSRVEKSIRKYIPVEKSKYEAHTPVHREKLSYNESLIYFYDMPYSSQSIIMGYVKGDTAKDSKDRHMSQLYTGYFGGDMSSLLFQEIREFRSYAYRVNAKFQFPSPVHKGKSGILLSMLSTQGDKTIDALGVLDSLIRFMPQKPERISATKQFITNNINNNYPSFRDISKKVASWKHAGYKEDPNRSLYTGIQNTDINDISRFYEEQVSGRPIIYIIVGNSRTINMEKLSSFGKIIKVKEKDIYR